jgi:hypothetical protein
MDGKIGQTFIRTYRSSSFRCRSPVRYLVGSVTPSDDTGQCCSHSGLLLIRLGISSDVAGSSWMPEVGLEAL